MMANTTCFISAKGGSGKTVTSSAMGTFLSSLGFRILLVDTDAATNGMTLLYLEQLLGLRRRASGSDATQIGLFEASEGVIPTAIQINQKLDLIPASFSMRDTENTDHSQFMNALKSVVQQRESYDFILLDAQAGSDYFAKVAADSAEQCVIVSEYDPVSAQGIERLKVLFANVMTPSSTWTLFNKVLPEFAAAIGEGLSVARYLTPLPWDADVVRAFARRDLAIDMRSPNAYTLAIAQVAYNLFPDETGDAIEAWRGEALKAITSPVEYRLGELREAEEHLTKLEERRERVAKIITTAGAGLFAASVAASSSLFLSVFKYNAIKAFFLDLNTQFIFLAVFATLAVGGAFYFYSIVKNNFGLSRERTDQLTLDLIHQEQAKLKVTLEAADAALKISENAGYYERRRRDPSPM